MTTPIWMGFMGLGAAWRARAVDERRFYERAGRTVGAAARAPVWNVLDAGQSTHPPRHAVCRERSSGA